MYIYQNELFREKPTLPTDLTSIYAKITCRDYLYTWGLSHESHIASYLETATHESAHQLNAFLAQKAAHGIAWDSHITVLFPQSVTESEDIQTDLEKSYSEPFFFRQMLALTPTHIPAHITKVRDTQILESEYAAIFVDETSTLHIVTTARFYHAKRDTATSAITCILWIHHKDTYAKSFGQASGYGYHKPSAALANALAYINIPSTNLAGRGDGAIKKALQIVASWTTGSFDHKKFFIHHAHA